jgi:ABC-type Zn uptake system ZnuABC Zn-binding protein ZnuA
MASGDLLLRAGAGFDDWAMTLARRVQRADLAASSIDLSKNVPLLEVKGRAVEASDGHAHGAANPHWWLDPVNAKSAVASIAAAILAADPTREAELSARLDSFNAALDAALLRWSAALAPYANRPVLAYHNSFPYLARRFRRDGRSARRRVAGPGAVGRDRQHCAHAQRAAAAGRAGRSG